MSDFTTESMSKRQALKRYGINYVLYFFLYLFMENTK